MAKEQKKNAEIDARLNKWMEQNKTYVAELNRNTKANLVRKVCVRDMLRAEEKAVNSQKFNQTLERFVSKNPDLAKYIEKQTKGLSAEEAIQKRKQIAHGALKKARQQNAARNSIKQ